MKRLPLVIIIVLLVSVFAPFIMIKVANAPSESVGWWKLNEGSGTTAADSSDNGHTGTFYNGPTWVDGKYGKALNFDGVDDYVGVPDGPSLSSFTQLTLEAWAKADSLSMQKGYVVTKSDGIAHPNANDEYGLFISGHNVTFHVANGGTGFLVFNSADNVINDADRWYHIAGVWNSSTYAIYIDGQVLSNGSAISGTSSDGTAPLQIGRNGGFSWTYFNGTIDDVRIYDRALSREEIQVDMSFRGPSMDSLYIRHYSTSGAVYNALKYGEVDLTDSALNDAQMEEVFNDTNIQAAISPAFTVYEFDFNNNATTPTYSNWTSPTAYKGFRQGIACLVNKNYIVNNICNYSYRVDTPIPRPNGNWWVDWSVSQYDPYGNLLGNYPYEYNSTLAAYYFDLCGFVQGNASNPYYDESFPSSAQSLRVYPESHPKHGQNLDLLNVYIRNDDQRRLQAGRMLVDNLRKMGISVNATETNRATCMTKVVEQRDYHIYTGGWSFSTALTPLSLYMSEVIGQNMDNYPQFRNATYDEWAKKALTPSSLELVGEAATKCQRILMEEAVCAWLYDPSQVMGYRNIYGVVNLRGGRVDNSWTFLTGRLVDARTTINYGLRSPPVSLNIVKDYLPSSTSPEVDCLDRIYDTLLSYNPYEKSPAHGGETMPWMAMDWDVGEWQSPYESGKNLTKLTFYLRGGIRWHDGIELNSTDVQFTVEYLKGLGNLTSLQGAVYDVHHVTTPNPLTVVVYENISNVLMLDTIGKLPILPKHIFQSISNVTGYTPGAGQGLLANQTLIGSGPWKYVSHNSSMLQLEANRDYFMETPPKGEVDFRYDWEMGCWGVDALDATMVAEATNSSGRLAPTPKWEPGCDLTGDCFSNSSDLSIVCETLNATWGRSARRYIPPPPTDYTVFVETSENATLVGHNFTVYVKMFVLSLTKLSGVQFKLNYDNSKLDCLDLNVTRIFSSFTYDVKKEANQTQGLVWVSMSCAGPMQLINGTRTLARITFNATKPSGSILDLWNTKLVTYGAPSSTCQPLDHKTLDGNVMVGVSTPTGTNVTVAAAENANVTFARTNTEGVTTLNMTQAPSTEFVSVLCYDIKTTATYTGNITLQFAYDPTELSLEEEQAMKIWLWNQSSLNWIDITVSVDTDKNIVYGITPHLSIFGVTKCLEVQGNVVSEGETTIGTPSTPPPPPPGHTILNYYDIKTTTIYSGPVTIGLAYDGTVVSPQTENFIQLWRWNPSLLRWDDITSFVDTEKNIVHGVSPGLSIFGVTSVAPFPQGIAVIEGTFSKTVVGEGYSVIINVTVENQGDFTKSFDIMVYANSTVIGAQPILNLAPSQHSKATFTWSTTGWVKSNYTINACDHPIGLVKVTIPGDVDGNFRVTMGDIVAICDAFGSARRPDGNYWHATPCLLCPHSPNCDIDYNGQIDMGDIITACDHFGKSYP